MAKKTANGAQTVSPEVQTMLLTQEKPLSVGAQPRQLFIGIPKESSLQENRIGLTPAAVRQLVESGHEIRVEAGAGAPAKFADHEFSDAGATVVYSIKEVYDADILLKVAPPTNAEIEYLHPGQTLISALQMSSLNPDFVNALCKKKINAISFQLLKDKSEAKPVVRAMSEIAGNTVMLIAAEYLSSMHEGRGIIIGGCTGVPPTRVVIIGAGTVAEHAARAALGLGAEVKVFDNHLYKLRRIKHNLGTQLFTSTFDTAVLEEEIRRADVVIGALITDEGRTPIIITEETVSQMAPGSIVIDVCIDQGGCVETSEMTTHSRPVFRKYDVIHYCVPNIASRVPRTATMALSNIFTPIFLDMAREGGVHEAFYANEYLRSGVYIYKGMLTNAYIAQKFNMRHKELSLLMAIRN